MTTTTVINTVENETFATVYDGGNILVTSTGGYIDTSGDGLEFVSTSTAPIGVVTIEAGGLVFGNGNGIDFTGFNANGSFLIDGSVQGNVFGMSLTDEDGDTGSPNVTIGSQGSVSGGTYGIYAALGSTSDVNITNHGTITGTEYGIRAAANQVDITNTGTIDGIDIFASSNQNYITNLGMIDGTLNVTSQTGIVNSGYIVSIVQNQGDPPISDVGLTNSGTIGGAVDLGNTSTVYNNGMIEGAVSTGNDSYVAIGPQGSVEDYGYTAIYVGANSVVKNAGFVDGGTGTGVVAGGASDATLTNTGTIMGGVNFSASSDDTITNGGTLSGGLVLGSGDHVLNTGVIHNGLSGDGTAYIENEGTISGGIDLIAAGGNAILNLDKIGGGLVLGAGDTTDNSGTIAGGIIANGGNDITNSGTITYGITEESTTTDTIDNSGKIAGGISEQSADLTNSGTIAGGASFADKTTLENSGTISGAVTFAGSDDTVTNDGTIHGAVKLGSADTFTNDGIIHGTLTTGAHDTLNMSTGSVTGDIIGSAGYDTFEFSGEFGHYKISDFTTAGNHDIINFASDDFTSYSELQSHMAQEGNDVVITLDAGDDIVFLNMKLANLLSHDFTFS